MDPTSIIIYFELFLQIVGLYYIVMIGFGFAF